MVYDHPMSTTITVFFLIVVPVMFNVGFTRLARQFDYPDILRLPTGEVLERFRQGGSGLVMTWWAFALSAILFAPLAILLGIELTGADSTIVTLSVFVGVQASVVQFLGLIRWPFLVPYLAREAEAADPGSTRDEAIDIVFQSFNRYLGVAVGEHLGYFFTGAWTLLTGVAVLQSDAIPGFLGVIGILAGPLFILSSFEFLGKFEPTGWELAGTIVPIVYIVWSLWLVALGIGLLV